MTSAASETGELRLGTCLGGAWQMACDSWLLERRRPSFRLYRWQRPTLSLGHHQRSVPPHWLELARSGALDLVRRPSGGRAVLHGSGITYALVWPHAPAQRQRAYQLACGWLQLAFAEMGLPLGFGAARADTRTASCFASGTAADLVHLDGGKRVGSAQLWRRGCLLQHGEILVQPNAALWRQLFDAPPPDLPPLPADGAELEDRLLVAAERALPLPIDWRRPLPWRALELAAIAAGLNSYRLPVDGTPSRASPAARIERTTWARASPRG